MRRPLTATGLAGALLVLGCSGQSSAPTGPTLGDIGTGGHTVVQTAAGPTCIPAGQPIPLAIVEPAAADCRHHCPPPPRPIVPRTHADTFTPGPPGAGGAHR